MPDLNEIRPMQRIHPAIHEHRGGTGKKQHDRKQDKAKTKQNTADNKGKVDEYI